MKKNKENETKSSTGKELISNIILTFIIYDNLNIINFFFQTKNNKLNKILKYNKKLLNFKKILIF